MTVSLRATSKKYRGRKAETYDEIRERQARWKLENEAVASMTAEYPAGTKLLDCPVGTGRYLALWRKRKYDVTGADVSDEMMSIAKTKCRAFPLVNVSATDLLNTFGEKKFAVSVCVRFLDLIDEGAMYEVMDNLTRVTKSAIVLTIRFGDKYVPKSNTAEHDEKKFWQWCARRGWRAAQITPVFERGWNVVKLVPGKAPAKKSSKT